MIASCRLLARHRSRIRSTSSSMCQHRPPLFLSDAWCDYERSLESQVKMLEDKLLFHDSTKRIGPPGRAVAACCRWRCAVSQTIGNSASPVAASIHQLVEVAQGRSYLLSSAYGSSKRRGVVSGWRLLLPHRGRSEPVHPGRPGQPRRVQRIEITNCRDGFQERAKYLFAVLAETDSPGRDKCLSDVHLGAADQVAWMECGTDVPGVTARYVTIISPVNTALHFGPAGLRRGPVPA